MIAKAQTYEGLQIFIDGGTFVECTFNNCTMIYSGLMQGQIQSCRFEGCEWKFSGPARNGLDFLGVIYSIGDSGREIVEGIFQGIRDAGVKRAQERATPSRMN